MLNYLFYFLLIVITLNKVFAADCENGISTGNENFKKDKDNIDETTGVMFLVTSSMYKYTCCGLVRQFKSFALADGDLYYIIWRPTGREGKYRVASTLKSALTGTPKSSSVLPSGSSQPQVADGDLIGWYSPGQSSVPYVDSTKMDGATFMMPRTGPVPEAGDVVDWNGATEHTHRMYALSTVIADGVKPPEFKVASDSVEARTSAAVGALVYRLSVTARPSQDTIFIMETSSQFFELNADNNIAVKSLLEPGTFEIVVSATDVCGYSSSTTITVTVTESTGKSSNPTTPSVNVATTDPQPPNTNDPDTPDGVTDKEDETSVTIGLPIFNLTLTPIDDLNSTYTNKTELFIEEDDEWKYALGFGITILMCIAITLCVYYLLIWKKKRQSTQPKKDPEKTPEANTDDDAKDGGTESGNCKDAEQTNKKENKV